ncbi:uncharacterized protein LOC126680607 [Mercurialis annua]|uniref:uncharacterized protein LOC126680607 n=1 Tax=Mercurialis annua TaxID=3986 RepID=UPI00215F2A13|nr:uncharacterized protein LOC126680607 [Mercurialis annua]
MEVHPRVNSMVAKRLWNVLRVSFLMLRKGFVSKRKLMMDMNLMMKRGKFLRKSLSNLLSHHHRSRNGRYGLQEYEFSCSNSPNPVFFHLPKRKHHYYFPCINQPQVIEEQEEENGHKAMVMMLPITPEYSFNIHLDSSYAYDFAPGEQKHSPSQFSVRISDYSSEEENCDSVGINEKVDDEAEEFITRFYEQLRVQREILFLKKCLPNIKDYGFVPQNTKITFLCLGPTLPAMALYGQKSGPQRAIAGQLIQLINSWINSQAARNGSLRAA